MDVRLAQREEREAQTEFGKAYAHYVELTPCGADADARVEWTIARSPAASVT